MGVNDIILLLLIALAAADVVEGQIRMRSAKNVPRGKSSKKYLF